jgi:hypothetical protein
MKLKREEIKEEVKEEAKEEIKKVDVPEFYMLGMRESISDVAKKFGMKKEDIEKLNGCTVFSGGTQIKLR